MVFARRYDAHQPNRVSSSRRGPKRRRPRRERGLQFKPGVVRRARSPGLRRTERRAGERGQLADDGEDVRVWERGGPVRGGLRGHRVVSLRWCRQAELFHSGGAGLGVEAGVLGVWAAPRLLGPAALLATPWPRLRSSRMAPCPVRGLASWGRVSVGVDCWVLPAGLTAFTQHPATVAGLRVRVGDALIIARP